MTPARLLRGLKSATRRMVSDWPVVAAALATVVLAATLLSAGPIYGEAITISAFERAMANASPDQAGISISARPYSEDFEATDRLVNQTVATSMTAAESRVTAIARASILDLEGRDNEAAEIWHVSGIEELATLTEGRWPASDGPTEVAVPSHVADTLGITVGQAINVAPRSGGSPLSLPVVGIFTVDDIEDIAWFLDPMIAEGSITSAGDTIYGPLIASRSAVVNNFGTDRLRVTWRVAPDFGTLQIDNLGRFSRAITGLADSLNGQVASTEGISSPEAVTFTSLTGLQDRLATINRSLSVTSSTILAVILQLSLLALYALVLTSRLVVDTRTTETALARSRGASPSQVAMPAGFEGFLLAIPAIALGPPLAAWLIRGLNRFGPLASIGLTIDPKPNRMAYVLASAAALVAIVTLLWPAFRAARAFPDQERKTRRSSGQSSTQKLGIDLALIALVAIAIWQLRELGPQVSATVRGRFGVDPLMVVAPALGLAAGVILALRVIPRLARMSERIVAARVPAVPALAMWQVARRPDRYARSSLLLMTAVALGVFASSFSASWLGSQTDQASHRVGADVTFIPRSTPDVLSGLHLRQALESLPGVDAALPVSEIRGAAASGVQARFIITDAASVTEVVKLRPDVAGDIGDLARQMVEDRVSLPSIPLPGEPAGLTMVWEATELPDPEVPGDVVEPCPQETGGSLNCFYGALSLVVEDAHGALHRIDAGPVFAGHGPTQIDIGLLGPNGEPPAYPLELAMIEFVTTTGRGVEGTVTTSRPSLLTLRSAELTDTAGNRQPLVLHPSDLAISAHNRSSSSVVVRPTARIQASDGPGLTFGISPGLALSRLVGSRESAIFAVAPAAPPIPQTYPVIATDALLDGGLFEVGMRLSLRPLGLARASGVIIGTVPAFAGVDQSPALIMLVDRPTYQALRFAPGEPIEPPEQYWLTTGDSESVAAALSQPPIRAAGIVTRDDVVSDLTSDPIALGTVGAFAIGFVAAAVFAVIGFTISALVSARERYVEFSLLHALGLDRGQLSRWLILEQAVLVILSLGLGLAVGIGIGEFLLPLITLNQDGSPAVPELIVQHAWRSVWAFQLALLVTLAVVLVALIIGVARRGVGAGLRFGDDT